MVGLGVYDCLARDITDPDTGEVYPALSCCNDKTMADRCTDPNAAKVIWSIKASAQFNSDCAILLREGFKSGRIRLLDTEYAGEEYLGELSGYNSLNPAEKFELQLAYIHTTLLIDELTKLQHDESGGKVRIFERSGMRKDRYSSINYNFYVATLLENKINRMESNNTGEDMFIIKTPNLKGRAVSRVSGRKQRSWRD